MTEPPSAERWTGTPFGPEWRAEIARAQESVLPAGRTVVSCSAPFGRGGLGRHLEELVGALERRGEPTTCICEPIEAGAQTSQAPAMRALTAALAPLARVSPAWRMWRASAEFDRGAASQLAGADNLIGFNGTSVAQFRIATAGAWKSRALVSATAHIARVVEQQNRAHRQYPVERPWATRLIRRNLIEYAGADRVYVSSRYALESFLERGYSGDRLSLFPLTPAPRFTPEPASRTSPTFDIVYVGSLTVDKGVPLLIDAFRHLTHTDMRLVLVGGWTTRGMRRLVEEACSRDARIEVCVGDPLPRLRSSRLYVHPTYNDGFGYAPVEALACGIPAIVSEDAGMKDLIDPGRNGLVVATGDRSMLIDAIEGAYRAEIFS